MDTQSLDEESKALLRRIVERTAYRQVMAANIRGHGIKYITELEEKVHLATDLEDSLAVLSDVERFYIELGGTDLSLATRERLEKIPYPYSRLELAVCLSLCDRTERLVAGSYLEGKSTTMRALSQRLVGMERKSTHAMEEMFISFSSDPTNAPTAQQFLNRWLALTLLAFGRPETPGDQRAVALKLRTRTASEIVRAYIDELRPFLAACGLVLPRPALLDVELTGDVLAVLQASEPQSTRTRGT
jgi:hypothetical protein